MALVGLSMTYRPTGWLAGCLPLASHSYNDMNIGAGKQFVQGKTVLTWMSAVGQAPYQAHLASSPSICKAWQAAMIQGLS